MPDPVRELTIGQRFYLGILCEEFDQAVEATGSHRPTGDRERTAVVAHTARIARYLAHQGVHWDQFTAADREDYGPAFFAAVLIRHPSDFDPGTLGHDILTATSV